MDMGVKTTKVVCLLFTVFYLNIAFAKVETVLGALSLVQNPNLPGSMPYSDSSEIIISRNQYIISYNKERRAPNWVAWKLEASQIGNSGRTNNFVVDTELENYLVKTGSSAHAVDPNEYKGSCFDRGHQIPSADRSDSVDDNQMTFFMSNMIPQTPYLNRVVWEHLEQYTRDLVQQQNKKVYVIAGPIYDDNFGAIGPHHDIPVPSKDFKAIIILDPNQTLQNLDQAQVIYVVMPNTLEDGTKPLQMETTSCPTFHPGHADRTDWKQYITNLQTVESMSGLHLFTKIPAVQNTLVQ
jgi:endonuclease G